MPSVRQFAALCVFCLGTTLPGLFADSAFFTASLYQPPTSFAYPIGLPFRIQYTTAAFETVVGDSATTTRGWLQQRVGEEGLQLSTGPISKAGQAFYLCSRVSEGDPPCLVGDETCSDPNDRFCAVTYAVTISPLSRPTILEHPRPIIRVPGDSARFEVTAIASSGADLAYQWHRVDGPIAGANDRVLEIPLVSQTDYGIYWCAVEDANGETLTAYAPLYLPNDFDGDGLDDRLERRSLQYLLVPTEGMSWLAAREMAHALGYRMARPPAEDRQRIFQDTGIFSLAGIDLIYVGGQFYALRQRPGEAAAPWGYDDLGRIDQPDWFEGEPNQWLGLDERYLSIFGVGVDVPDRLGKFNDTASDTQAAPYPASWRLASLWIVDQPVGPVSRWDDPDSDGDGLTDGVEVLSLGTNPSAFDSDGDGSADSTEVAAGTDPLDAEARPDLDFSFDPGASTISFNSVGAPGASPVFYYIEWSTDLGAWTRTFETNPFGNPEEVAYPGTGLRQEIDLAPIVGSMPEPRFFVRLIASPLRR
jgi:hypothetical protein